MLFHIKAADDNGTVAGQMAIPPQYDHETRKGHDGDGELSVDWVTTLALTILRGSPGIVERVSRSNWTLGDTIDAIHVRSQPLSDSMPVNAGAILAELVLDNDCDIL